MASSTLDNVEMAISYLEKEILEFKETFPIVRGMTEKQFERLYKSCPFASSKDHIHFGCGYLYQVAFIKKDVLSQAIGGYRGLLKTIVQRCLPQEEEERLLKNLESKVNISAVELSTITKEIWAKT